jgi:hypothetical protein
MSQLAVFCMRKRNVEQIGDVCVRELVVGHPTQPAHPDNLVGAQQS